MNRYESHALTTWAVEERPREKMMAKGVQFLTDTELLAILLGSGTRNMTAVEVARLILKGAGNDLQMLGRQGIRDLTRVRTSNNPMIT